MGIISLTPFPSPTTPDARVDRGNDMITRSDNDNDDNDNEKEEEGQ